VKGSYFNFGWGTSMEIQSQQFSS